MINIALCDDDVNMLHRVNSEICNYTADINSAAKITQFKSSEALSICVKDGDSFDLYILDIEMPEINGIELATEIRTFQPTAIIIFLTSHFGYADLGYRVQALRYVQKLKLEKDLREALDAAFLKFETADDRYITVKHYNSMTLVMERDIICVKKILRSLHIFTTTQGELSLAKGIKQFYSQVSSHRFVFTDRSCFVNLSFIRQLTADSVVLNNGEEILVSRANMPEIKEAIMSFVEENDG